MDKKKPKFYKQAEDILPRLKSYSTDEIMAAGGPDKFAEKFGKNTYNLIEHIKQLSKEDLLTEEEYLAALATLNQSK